ncbi:transporter substrate-binding domain-containing protein [Nonomuraea turkmeniaca]|uniref:Transporter substrate-binding domain-containing protein n=1 Tax=Nonomuraea turkmeniaca TaxID=103838 RepID=A0A5S4F6X4_9ACTN|nr:transporter substrate-binding domain-containing protein [Nonomuraea turkmeniaca]TMR11973.1 transporter substrate-binding domain-containing protein [Nonomuraea turkmeniaca]
MKRALILLSALAMLAGCASDGQESIMDKDDIVIAVRSDLPSVGFRKPDDTFEGFDVDVARYVADKLGKHFTLLPVLAADREKALLNRQADLVVATYTISQERKAKVLFAGPYHVSYQDILTRRGEPIRNVRDLKGRSICEVKGSNAAQRVVEERKVAARLVPFDDYNACLAALKGREVDAVTTNDVILAGLAKQDPSGLQLNNAQFNEQRSGIGMRKGDVPACEAVNRAITDMYQDGTAARLLDKWFGTSGLDLSTAAVPQFEGCS